MEIEIIGNDPLDIAIGGDAIAGILVGAEFHLTKAALAMSRDVVLADLTAIEANFVGYAAKAITFGPATMADDGEIEYLGLALEFRPTNAVTPNEIFGGWVQNGAGVLLWCFAFDSTLPMGAHLDSILLTLRYRPADDGGFINVIS